MPFLVFAILLLSLTPVIQSQNQPLKATASMQSNEVDIIVYTAIQDWPSKSWIYLLTIDGTPITSYSYDWYIFNDVEVVNNEVYVTDWVAPRLYKVNISTGALTVIIDDWSLYYMYDVAFDGTYFYINEWKLNRYTINGVKDSSISFNYKVRGSAWDGTYYWTLLNTTEIKCWDISSWPMITEITGNSFYPPSSACRGLWYDGTYFWTAESIEGTTGYIYQFDETGSIITQIPEPQTRGYAACLVTIQNAPPQTPSPPQGPSHGNRNQTYSFSTLSYDPEDDAVYYQWDWDTGPLSPWFGPYPSGMDVQQTHHWEDPGVYEIRVRAKDLYGSISPWSDPHTIVIGNQPPTPPVIQGPPQGKPGVSYLYKFSSTDPEGDMVFYRIDWGDSTPIEWTGPYASGEEQEVSHEWDDKGTYLVRAQAKDTHGNESSWGTLEVTIPTTRQNRAAMPFQQLLEKHFLVLPLLLRWVIQRLHCFL